MIKALVRIRFLSMLSALTAQGRKKNKSSKSTLILYAVLYLYVLAVVCGMMGVTFFSLAQPYHAMGLDWLYFAVAALMSLGLCVFGSVFSTQNQLYAARDNALLLSMPIKPRDILISRMLPLLAVEALFAGAVLLPAMVVYGVFVEFSPLALALQLLTLVGVVLLGQAISCLLGWLLHLLMRRLNRSVASVLFMVLFLGAYFGIYSQAQAILNSLITNAGAIAETLALWVWPVYAAGHGCSGSIGHALAFLGICTAAFGLCCGILSRTFLRSVTASQHSARKRKLVLTGTPQRSPIRAVADKELKKFLHTPVYLTNMGLGILLMAALPIVMLILRGKLLSLLGQLGNVRGYLPLLICAACAFNASTMCISTPSVSLEGKNVWILKSMPIASMDILKGKLLLHIRLTVPVSVLSGGIMAAVLGCGIEDILLCAVLPGLLATLSGVLGMAAGLKWARLDYISEAFPCKQSVSVVVAMFVPMGIVFALGLGYLLLLSALPVWAFLALCAVVLALLCLLFYRILQTWGVKKWESL